MQRILITSLLFSTGLLLAKNGDPILKTRQSDWQQRVDHNIKVTLDPKKMMLYGEETIQYTNNSPDALHVIRMHIWPNAFSSRKTAYGKEAVLKGNSKFLQARKAELGYLDSLSFTVNGQPATFSQFEGHEDIIEILLPQPVKPGETATIYTPFRVKIPFLFSRMGYSGDLFSITQWYPKPAVYDANGWNTFPYLEQGEYYSEFGTYKVQITLPANYVVGATGELQQEEELEWMTELSEGTAERRDSNRVKTLEYVQDHVSDFAWFADPGFKVFEKEVALPDGRKVHAFALIAPDASGAGSNVLDAIETALKYYGKRVGSYPYNFCTAVIGKLTAAGGMEYPMITICGDGSEGTVIHEVGHNWFQMMLGSQERNYPWMDESINTFYQWYAEGKAPVEWETGERTKIGGGYSLFRIAHDLGVFQEGDIHSECYHGVNYGGIVYSANPLRFAYLQEYLGKSMMDSCMKTYFSKWQYRHPLPGDIRAAFESVSGRDLGWFFEGLIGGPAPDVAIKSVKRSKTGFLVQIRNHSEYRLPVKLEWRSDNKKEEMWIMASDTTIRIPVAKSVRLNPSGFLTESHMENNESRTTGILKTYGKFQYGLPDLYRRGNKKIWVFPNFFTFNTYDGYTPGLIFSNITFPRKRWEWWLAPSYGLSSGIIVGNAGIQRNIWFKKGLLSMAEIFAGFKSYSFEPEGVKDIVEPYYHTNLGGNIFFKRGKPWVQHSVHASLCVNRIDEKLWPNPGLVNFKERSDRGNNLLRLQWIRGSFKKLSPGEIMAEIEAGTNRYHHTISGVFNDYSFVKTGFHAVKFIPYHFLRSRSAGVMLRGFGSVIFDRYRSNTSGVFKPLVSGASGVYDYGFRDVLLARSEGMGTGSYRSHQLLANTSAMRMLPAVTADRFAAGVNVTSSFIPKVPLKLFGDAALAGNDQGSKLYWAGGVCLSSMLGTNVVYEINLPLIYSSGFDAAMSGLKWYEGWNFKLNLALYNPYRLARAIYQ